VFLVATAVCAIGFVLVWFLPERPLRATVAAGARDAGNEAGEVFARPSDEDAVVAHLYAAFSSLADRDVQRAHVEQIVARAGETLGALAAWLLIQIELEPKASPFELARSQGIPPERAQAALEELRRRGLVTVPRADSTAHSELTPTGCQVLERLVSARRAHLAELAEEWDPTRDDDAVAYLRNAVRDLVPDVRHVG
jgi:DNA-binding MarR family transcriptional regulator